MSGTIVEEGVDPEGSPGRPAPLTPTDPPLDAPDVHWARVSPVSRGVEEERSTEFVL